MGRPRRNAVSKKALILKAARDLLAEGTDRLTTEAVAARANVSKKTLYANFSDREEILAAVMAAISTELGEGFDDVEYLVGEPESALPAYGQFVLSWLAEPSMMALNRFLVMEGRQFPALRAKLDDRVLAPVVKGLARYLKEESARGTLRVPDARLAATQFLGMLKEPTVWPRLLGQSSATVRPATVVAAASRTFLAAYAPKTRRS